ncbi:helix-turn-helix domain-containing protein [Syntrophomonas palmitatica]|uniref:helix-turn-helix domain-containing protein n=1 Tax=Syntrophomonas palmitatica TaxID=402877 RepID=UPI0006D1E7E5|nr:helix-turn-helix transcriptional regulator [Syntrophomonas palmitatica]
MTEYNKSKKTYHPTFGRILRRLREEYGVNAIQLAEFLGINKNHYQIISQWETGKREPNLVQVCNIANFFGVTTDMLLGMQDIELIEPKIAIFLRQNRDALTSEDEEKIMKILSAFLK